MKTIESYLILETNKVMIGVKVGGKLIKKFRIFRTVLSVLFQYLLQM